MPSALQPAEVGERTSFCPDDPEIAAFFENTSGARSRARVAQHLAACGHCRARLGMLARLARIEDREDVPEDLLARAKQLPSGGRTGLRTWHAAMAAAVVVLAIGLFVGGGWFAGLGPGGHPADPGGETPARQLRSLDHEGLRPRILNPAADAELGPGAVVFRWTPVEGALRYQVLLLDESGRPLLAQQLEATTWEFDDVSELQPGRRYYVRVIAELTDGRAAASGHTAFSVGAPTGTQD